MQDQQNISRSGLVVRKKVCSNNEKTFSREISLKRSIVYSSDDYNHVSSQEGSSELQSLYTLPYLVFFYPWIFTMWSSLPSSGLLDTLHLINDCLIPTHLVFKTVLSDATYFRYVQSWKFLSKCLLNASQTIILAKKHKKYM